MASSTPSTPSGGHYFRPTADEAPQFLPFRATLAGAERDLVAARGIFSPKEIDKGTAILLRQAPQPESPGQFLDLGCGWGPIALTMALQQPEATVWALDVNEHALASTSENAVSLGLTCVRPVVAEQVPADVEFDLIWSNPPIRVGKAVLHELLLTWLPRLRKGGEAWLVVQKHLGSDSLLRWLQQNLPEDFAAERAFSEKGFRLLKVYRTS